MNNKKIKDVYKRQVLRNDKPTDGREQHSFDNLNADKKIFDEWTPGKFQQNTTDDDAEFIKGVSMGIWCDNQMCIRDSIQVGRPNKDDTYSDVLFGSLVRLKIRDDNFSFVSVPGKYPYCKGVSKGKFHPETNETCQKCKICVEKCPVHAISDDCKTISDTCISCFRCIKVCPIHAKNMDNDKSCLLYTSRCV